MEQERFTLTQEHFDALVHRRALDAKFEAFMAASIADREDIRARVESMGVAVAGNTRTINEVHVALFAKTDDNEFGITGLVTNMQSVVKHTQVVCNIAKFMKWLAVGVVAAAGGFVTLTQFTQAWGAW